MAVNETRILRSAQDDMNGEFPLGKNYLYLS
jgi:hypothetical protein